MLTSGAGFEMPARYTEVEQEHRAVRERVGIMDLSHMTRYDIKGEDSFDLMQKLAVNDASKLTDGQAMYTTFCDSQGNIVDDVTVWRFGPEHFRIVSSSRMRYKTVTWLETNIDADMNVYVTDITSSLGCISVQGPRSRDTLQKISSTDLAGLKLFRFTTAKLGGVSTIIARAGYSGELGYECYVNAEDTVDAWNKIMEAGKEFALLPYGYDALTSLRLEKGFIYFGGEVTDKNNPFECGLDRFVKLEKPTFVGKEALSKLKQNGPERKLIGLMVDGEDIVPSSRAVIESGRRIGETVLGFRALTVGKNMAWAYVNTANATEGERVTVDTPGKTVPATITDIRCYDPTGERMRA